MYEITQHRQIKVFKENQNPPARGRLKVKPTVLGGDYMRIPSSSNVLCSVGHRQVNVTPSNIYITGYI